MQFMDRSLFCTLATASTLLWLGCSDSSPLMRPESEPISLIPGADAGGAAACQGDADCGEDSRCSGGICLIDNPGSPGNTPPRSGNSAEPPATCADQVLRTNRVKPKVILVVDQSGSMDQDFSSPDGTLAGSRWNILRDFLLQGGGLIDSLQDVVQFGLAMYSARSEGSLPEGTCPLVTTVAPALDNYAAIDALYSAADPIDETPTGDAIDAIVADLMLDQAEPDALQDPVVFVIATDGEPDRCEELNPQNGQMEAIDAVSRAFALGIRSFVISVGGDVSAQHQQDIANAGLGRPLDTADPATFWTAGDTATLRDALVEIVGGQVSCDITLNGAIEGDDECLGTVTLGDTDLVCNDPNGWMKVSPQQIRLLGSACDTLKADNPVVAASFPCEVEITVVQ